MNKCDLCRVAADSSAADFNHLWENKYLQDAENPNGCRRDDQREDDQVADSGTGLGDGVFQQLTAGWKDFPKIADLLPCPEHRGDLRRQEVGDFGQSVAKPEILFQPRGHDMKADAHREVAALGNGNEGFLDWVPGFDGGFNDIKEQSRPFRAAHGQREKEMNQV